MTFALSALRAISTPLAAAFRQQGRSFAAVKHTPRILPVPCINLIRQLSTARQPRIPQHRQPPASTTLRAQPLRGKTTTSPAPSAVLTQISLLPRSDYPTRTSRYDIYGDTITAISSDAFPPAEALARVEQLLAILLRLMNRLDETMECIDGVYTTSLDEMIEVYLQVHSALCEMCGHQRGHYKALDAAYARLLATRKRSASGAGLLQRRHWRANSPVIRNLQRPWSAINEHLDNDICPITFECGKALWRRLEDEGGLRDKHKEALLRETLVDGTGAHYNYEAHEKLERYRQAGKGASGRA